MLFYTGGGLSCSCKHSALALAWPWKGPALALALILMALLTSLITSEKKTVTSSSSSYRFNDVHSATFLCACGSFTLEQCTECDNCRPVEYWACTPGNFPVAQLSEMSRGKETQQCPTTVEVLLFWLNISFRQKHVNNIIPCDTVLLTSHKH